MMRHSPPLDDELVPLARVIKESGLPAFRVRLALGEAGELVRVFSRIGLEGRRIAEPSSIP